MRISQLKITSLKNNLLIAGVLLLLSSCIDTNMVYHVHHSLPESTWQRGDTLSFQLNNLTHGHTYSIFLEGRFTQSYPYKNLQIKMLGKQAISSKLVIKEDKSGFYLAGESTNPIRYKADSAQNTLQFIPDMRRERLHGISDIGIRIEY